jgi:hypothetical protein
VDWALAEGAVIAAKNATKVSKNTSILGFTFVTAVSVEPD